MREVWQCTDEDVMPVTATLRPTAHSFGLPLPETVRVSVNVLDKHKVEVHLGRSIALFVFGTAVAVYREGTVYVVNGTMSIPMRLRLRGWHGDCPRVNITSPQFEQLLTLERKA